MGERDRYQSYEDRNEGRSQNRDREDEWRSQSRDRTGYYRDDRDYSRDSSRDYGSQYSERNYGSQYPERSYGQSLAGYESRRFPGTFGSYEDQQRYGREQNRGRNFESERNYGWGQDDRSRGYGEDRNQQYRTYGRSFGGSEDYSYGRGYGGFGGYQGGYQGGYGGYGGYQGDYRDRGESRGHEEGLGQQLKEAGQRFMGKMKRVFRSPKGYKRSDERIREDVNDRLGHEEQIDPTEIEVSVSNCEVTLTGTVQTRREKFLAEEIADDVGGVTEVHNQLRVGRSQTQQTGTSSDTTSMGTQSGTEASRSRNARAE